MSTYEYSDEQGDIIMFSSLPQFPFSMISISGKNTEGINAVRSVSIPDVEIEDFISNMRDALGLSEVPDIPVKYDPANGLIRVGNGINTVVMHITDDIENLAEIRDNYIAGVAWLTAEAEQHAETLERRKQIATKFNLSVDSDVVSHIYDLEQKLSEQE